MKISFFCYIFIIPLLHLCHQKAITKYKVSLTSDKRFVKEGFEVSSGRKFYPKIDNIKNLHTHHKICCAMTAQASASASA